MGCTPETSRWLGRGLEVLQALRGSGAHKCRDRGEGRARGAAPLSGPTAQRSSAPLPSGCSSGERTLSATGPHADMGTPVTPRPGERLPGRETSLRPHLNQRRNNKIKKKPFRQLRTRSRFDSPALPSACLLIGATLMPRSIPAGVLRPGEGGGCWPPAPTPQSPGARDPPARARPRSYLQGRRREPRPRCRSGGSSMTALRRAEGGTGRRGRLPARGDRTGSGRGPPAAPGGATRRSPAAGGGAAAAAAPHRPQMPPPSLIGEERRREGGEGGRPRLQPVPERQAESAPQRLQSSAPGCGSPAAAGSRQCGAPRCRITRRSAAVCLWPRCGSRLCGAGVARHGPLRPVGAPALLALPSCSAAQRGSEKAEMKNPNLPYEAVPPGLGDVVVCRLFFACEVLAPL